MKKTLLVTGPFADSGELGAYARILLKMVMSYSDCYDVTIVVSPEGDSRSELERIGREPWNYQSLYEISWSGQKPDVQIQIGDPASFVPRATKNFGVVSYVTENVNRWLDACNAMDSIIVRSEAARSEMMTGAVRFVDDLTDQVLSDKCLEPDIIFLPLHVMGGCELPFERSDLSDRIDRIEEEFLYLCSGDWFQKENGRYYLGLIVRWFSIALGKLRGDAALLLRLCGECYSRLDRDNILSCIEYAVSQVEGDKPRIYLLYGALSTSESKELYAHQKCKTCISLADKDSLSVEFALAGKPSISISDSQHAVPHSITISQDTPEDEAIAAFEESYKRHDQLLDRAKNDVESVESVFGYDISVRRFSSFLHS